MVAATAPSADSGPKAHDAGLPDLFAADEALITRLFETEAPSLSDLFKSLSKDPIDGAPRSLLDLIRWSLRPDISPWLNYFNAQLTAAIRRRRVAKLELIADTSKDLVEQRRACTTALRHLSSPLPSCTPLHGGTSLFGGTPLCGGTPLRGVRKNPTTTNQADHPIHPPAHPDTPTSVHTATPAPDTPTNPAEPRPSGSETPQSPPAHDQAESVQPASPSHIPTCSPVPPPPSPLLELAFSHSLTPRDPVSIAALAGALAPTASINGHPLVPQSPLAPLPDPSSTLIAIDPPTITSTDDSFTWSATLTFENGVRSQFHVTLALIEAQWLITDLNHHMLNSG